MSLNNPVLGEGYVPAYQISPVPYVTSSQVTLGEIKEYSFPTVARTFSIKNNTSGTTIAVGFTRNGLTSVNSNFFSLSGGESYAGEYRTSAIFISGSTGTASFQMLVGLTDIPVKNFLEVTGSNGYTGVG
jgi:hypothetical protein